MTPDTLRFLRALLNRITLSVSDPEFVFSALSIITAINELDTAIQRAEDAANAPSLTLHDVDVP